MKLESNLQKSKLIIGIAISISIMPLLLSSIGIVHTELFSDILTQNANSAENNSSINTTNSKVKVQNLTNPNVAVTLLLVTGYANGNKVFYITT